MGKVKAIKGLGKAFKSWQDKRIDAMNRIITTGRGSPAKKTERFIEEYGEVSSSKAKSKKEYKIERKKNIEKGKFSLKGNK